MDDQGVPELRRLVSEEIRTTGPITFARFMERALYEPGLGYYATTHDRATREGDFLTAPEMHPIFGWTLARQVDEMWHALGEPREFTLREYGAGTGALGPIIRDGLRQIGSDLATSLRYEAIETEARPGAARTGGQMTGCVFANELLDALPVHRVVRDDGRLREIHVDRQDDHFVEVAGDLSDPRLADRIGPDDLSDGQQAEVSLAISGWLSEVSQSLDRGYVLLIDYGLPAAELRSLDRPTGTIRAFRSHHVSSDVLGGVGRQDLTAHVDLDALEADARATGFDVLGRTTQAKFLLGSGLDEVYQHGRQDADHDFNSALLIRSAVTRLLDPLKTGAYAVVILGKGVPTKPPLRGLAFDPARLA